MRRTSHPISSRPGVTSTAWRVALALCLLGCMGEVTLPVEDTGPRAADECREAPPALGRVGLRRLSRTAYQNTVRDLLFDVGVADLPEVPADVAEHGFENATDQLSSPALLVEAYEATATRYARAAVEDEATLRRLLACDSWETPGEQDACRDSFIARFLRRAYRRPPTDDEQDDLRAYFEDARAEIDFEAAVELSISAVLQAADVLYRVERGDPESEVVSPHEMASRLSYLLWQSMPDDALMRAADEGRLSTPEELEAQARRMLDDPRAQAAMVDFHRQWLDFDSVLEADKHAPYFPDWSPELRASARAEMSLFVASLYERELTLTALLADRTAWVNGPLAELYGLEPVEGWAQVDLPSDERAGILTRAGFLASQAHETNGSPVLRGVFVAERVLCREFGMLPDEVDTSLGREDPDMPSTTTNRERFEALTSPSTCQGCHRQINGIGFAFEHYDSTGAYRELDNGFAVDASGELVWTDVDGEYAGAVGLSERLAESDTVRECVAENWVRYTLGRAPQREDACLVERARGALEQSGGDLRELLVAVVTSPDFARGVEP